MEAQASILWPILEDIPMISKSNEVKLEWGVPKVVMAARTTILKYLKIFVPFVKIIILVLKEWMIIF